MNHKMTPEEFLATATEKTGRSPEEGYRFAKEVSEDILLKNPQTRQAALFFLAVSLFESAHYDEAESIVKGFIFDFEQYPFYPFYVDSFMLLSLVQFYKKRYYLAIFYGEQALSLAEEKKCVDLYSQIYSNLALPYQELKDYQKCLDHLDQALRYAQFSSTPDIQLALLYNRSSPLLALGRAEESRAELDKVEALAKASPTRPLCLDFLPFCRAEIALALHEEVDIHPLVVSFLNVPAQRQEDMRSYFLDEDEYLYTLLWKNGYKEDAALFLARIEEIQKKSPCLRTEIFLAKSHAEVSASQGDYLASGKFYVELSQLYEKEEGEFSKDFEEISKLHFDFVRVSNAYRKAQKRAEKLREESDTDALTLLANRRALEKEKKRFPLLAKKETYFALALLDYDHFKDINDTYGYQTGDEALRLGAQLFKNAESPTLRSFRYGGDEFIFALAVKSSKEAAEFFAHLKKGLEEVKLTSSEGEKVPLSCCIGYVLYAGTYSSYSNALKAATEAIHAAKKIGRGNIVSVLG